jgi:hypothetical protein
MCYVWLSEQTVLLPYKSLADWLLQPKRRVFTARYALSPYNITQIHFVLKGLIYKILEVFLVVQLGKINRV